MVSGSAQAVEEEVKHHADGSVNQSCNSQPCREQRFGMSEQEPLNQDHSALVDRKENYSEGKARGGMFRIELSADGRRKKSDQRFGNSVKAQRSFAEQILQTADGAAQQQSARRISAAQAEIDRDEQREIHDRHFWQVDRQESLNEKREKRGEQNRAATKFVHFDVCFDSAEIECVIHLGLSGFFASRSWVRFPPAGFEAASFAAGPECFAATAPSVSSGTFFITIGSVVSSTITSSSFSS